MTKLTGIAGRNINRYGKDLEVSITPPQNIWTKEIPFRQALQTVCQTVYKPIKKIADYLRNH